MPKSKLKNTIESSLPFDLNDGQNELANKLVDFILYKPQRTIFILRGYAGTGKSSLTGALVKSLPVINMKSCLLAPTGRAAKVLSKYSNKEALTIHKRIYFKKTNSLGYSFFDRAPSLFKNTIFFVDEASMIADEGGNGKGAFGNLNLLDDLINYVYSGEGCKLIFIGDTAQLPPVGSAFSPALSKDYLEYNFKFDVMEHELTQVVRQDEDSGVLFNATYLRNSLRSKSYPKLNDSFNDVKRINGYELQDELENAFSNYDNNDVKVICRSNKRSNIFNQQIRNRIFWHEEEISSGDLLMVVKNNYYWLEESSKIGFIANGDIVKVIKVLKYHEIYNLRFVDIIAELPDYPKEPEIEVRVLLDSIETEQASMPRDKMKEFYYSVLDDYSDERNKGKRVKKVLNDPFFNALQVKFAYSVTCHKSQGGQWPIVFVDQGYLTEEMLDESFFRWLYTAITRATEKVFLVNFNKEFFLEKTTSYD